MLQVLVPNFIHGVADEFCSGTFRCFVGVEVADLDGVLSFSARAYDGGGIVGNGRVRWWSRWDGKGRPPCCGVGGGWFNKSDQVVSWMRSVLVVRDVKEEGVKNFAKSGEVIVGRLPPYGLEGGRRRCEECGDFFRRHGYGGIRSGVSVAADCGGERR